MPIIRVEMFEGRDVDQKRELVKELTETFVRTCGGSPSAITIVIDDYKKENWGSGGELCSDKYPD